MSKLAEAWTIVKDAVASFGFVKGTFTLFFWVAQYWIYRLYSGRLKDRQREIDRIAKENREYRDRLLALMDKHFQVPQKKGRGK